MVYESPVFYTPPSFTSYVAGDDVCSDFSCSPGGKGIMQLWVMGLWFMKRTTIDAWSGPYGYETVSLLFESCSRSVHIKLLHHRELFQGFDMSSEQVSDLLFYTLSLEIVLFVISKIARIKSVNLLFNLLEGLRAILCLYVNVVVGLYIFRSAPWSDSSWLLVSGK